MPGKLELNLEFTHVNEDVSQRIVVAETAKVYLTKKVDANNKEGFFSVTSFCVTEF